MSRIELTDSIADVAVKMSEGNPGAVSVICAMLRDGGDIDPDAAFGGFGGVLMLDTFEIYGPRIWMFFKDVCEERIDKMMAMIRACQLGFVGQATLSRAIDSRGEGLDVEDLVSQVCKQLPRFKMKQAAKEESCETK